MEAISSQQLAASLSKEWAVVMEAKAFPMTPALQSLVDYVDPPLPPQPIARDWEDRRKHHLRPLTLKTCSQIPVAPHDLAGGAPSRVIGAHMNKEHGVVVCGPEELRDPLCNGSDAGPREAADFPG